MIKMWCTRRRVILLWSIPVALLTMQKRNPSIPFWSKFKKQSGDIDQLFVTGCLSERYKTDLEREIPQVDAYFGTTDLPHLLQALGADYKHELLGERHTTTPKNYAYFKVSEGCDRPCSFCAIPLMRGKHRSTPIEELVKRAKKLAQNGVKELLLIAQDLTYYGWIYTEKDVWQIYLRPS